ncbi:hypothetical protein [Aquimarina longa]|uniref:hypothetical protein n=1 Tax=Aquimarina longa TaxID=1080221 RepID=UPI0007840768|nr:hypothetical protein [Aquimarina longa]
MSITKVLAGLLVCILFSCNSTSTTKDKKEINSFEKDKYQIMTLLIEEIPPGPPPPLPPPGVYTKDTIAFNKYRDSIFKLDITIGVIDSFIPHNDDIFYHNIEKEYQILIAKLKPIKENYNHKIKLEKLQVKDNRKLIMFSSTDNTRQLLLDDSLDYVICFSEIILNPKKNKAIVVSSGYPHPKGGSSVLYLLKKENGNWKIFKRKLLSIS